ncbi:hypothetical protein [Prevotella amnii]|uniref:hypothetical protein n=1 Tax=Prevotella amnii TaxID=419005 RepID=UPI0018E1DE34|nr:hypothetical protein [Prevotella amnii]
MLKKLFMLRYSISTMRTIVASPEKLHRLRNELCSSDSNRLAMSVPQICILMALALSP